MADEQAPAVVGLDALSVVDLATVFIKGEEAAEAAGEDGLHGGIRAVRDHLLRTLAALAGEPEALGRLAWDAYEAAQVYRDDPQPWSAATTSEQKPVIAAALAVAVAVVAPVALALLQARKLIRDARPYVEGEMNETGAELDYKVAEALLRDMDAALAPLPAAVQAAVNKAGRLPIRAEYAKCVAEVIRQEWYRDGQRIEGDLSEEEGERLAGAALDAIGGDLFAVLSAARALLEERATDFPSDDAWDRLDEACRAPVTRAVTDMRRERLAAVQAAVEAHDRAVVERLASEAGDDCLVDIYDTAFHEFLHGGGIRNAAFPSRERIEAAKHAAIQAVAARVRASGFLGLSALADAWAKTSDEEIESRATGDCGGSIHAHGWAAGVRDCGVLLKAALVAASATREPVPGDFVAALRERADTAEALRDEFIAQARAARRRHRR